MFDPDFIIERLERNRAAFAALLGGRPPVVQRFRPAPGKWNLLEIACHLFDEEREDFRLRVHHTLETPDKPFPPIDPEGWVTARDYASQDYDAKLASFLHEREASITWLRELGNPDWTRATHHPRLGPMSARLFLANWLAHDLLHLRQILRTEHAFLQGMGEPLDYAGTW